MLQLHFAKPSVYHEIYNAKNRWTKDVSLYHLVAAEESTLSLCDYNQAKKRRDITLPLFSRKTVVSIQHLVQEGVCRHHILPASDFADLPVAARSHVCQHREPHQGKQAVQHVPGFQMQRHRRHFLNLFRSLAEHAQCARLSGTPRACDVYAVARHHVVQAFPYHQGTSKQVPAESPWVPSARDEGILRHARGLFVLLHFSVAGTDS